MNWLDIFVIIILALCILGGVRRGFIRTILGFANFIIAIILTNMFYPYMARFLRGLEWFYYPLRDGVAQSLSLDEAVSEHVGAAAYDVIQNLPLPQFLRDYIAANDNPIIRTSLAATGLTDFIGGFVTSIIINIISIIIVFILVFAGLVIITGLLDIIARLPVINTLNKLLGAAVGAVWGVLVIWFLLGTAAIFLAAGTDFPMMEALDSSSIARFFHEANPAARWLIRFIP
ncbi:MAG: CvpA family protein [Defluviitaleaceae bacterium]|nr:CvpA family protein [Defluviitaleaceae bacterium]